MLLSVFCGPGGLDLGFEQAGFDIALALDLSADNLATYRRNRAAGALACEADLSRLRLDTLDKLYGAQLNPSGLIGGPPCQSFSRANQSVEDDDPRHALPLAMARLAIRLNERKPLPFMVMENVPDLANRHSVWLQDATRELERAGFSVAQAVLNSADYGVPQKRSRLFVVALNKSLFGDRVWLPPARTRTTPKTVRQAIGKLPEPVIFERGLTPDDIPHHPNHWCMAPKSKKFKKRGALVQGRSSQRSFKTLQWDKPSLTVAYGHREVHIHPGCHRRLSVFEAMRLQGFPDTYVLEGSLSSQIEQVSEAVPPPLAEAVASSVAVAIRPTRTKSR